MVDDDGLEEILAACPDTADAADRLVKAAVAAGGEDNATAVVVEVVASVDESTPDQQDE
jgi:protein phosphatase